MGQHYVVSFVCVGYEGVQQQLFADDAITLFLKRKLVNRRKEPILFTVLAMGTSWTWPTPGPEEVHDMTGG